jgi:hypothetical protein
VGAGIYTNVVLTVIAVCLVLLCANQAGFDWSKYLRAQPGYRFPRGVSQCAPIPVWVFGTVDANVENTVDVNVQNTVDVQIER